MSRPTDQMDYLSLKGHFKQLRASIKARSTDIESQLDYLLDWFNSYFTSPQRYEADKTLEILSGRNCSPEGVAFLWVGCWRPSAAVSLVFSVLGTDSCRADKGPLDDDQLSEAQCRRLKQIQEECSRAEKELQDEVANVQMMVADQGVLVSVRDKTCIRQHIGSKVDSLSDLLKRADKLRLQTMMQLRGLLNPMQAARCSVAAFELAFAMRAPDSSPSSSQP